MVKRRVVISGVGILAPNAIGKEEFSAAIFEGRSGIKPISLFDTSPFKAKLGGEISNFRPEEFLGPKGLRTLDRSTRLACAASKLALDDAGLGINEDNADQIGVVVGTILGSVASISDFHKEAVTEGPRYVNPALFPNTVINSPASEVAIRFNIRGFNTTIATGFTASLDAIKYAADFLRLDRAKAVLVGGVEELCVQTFLGFYKTGFLAGVEEGGPELSCPYDARRNGMILAEAAVIFVLEDLDSALQRKAHILAEVAGYGNSFDAFRIDKYNPKGDGLAKALRLGLDDARLDTSAIDFICSAGNSMKETDLIETKAIKAAFKEQAKKVPVSAVKSMVGDCYSASAGLQVAASLAAIERQMIPPTINYEAKDPACDLDYVLNQPRAARIENVLVDALGSSGSNASMVISRYKG